MASANARKLDRLRWELRQRRQRERLQAHKGRRRREHKYRRHRYRRRKSSPGRAHSLLVPSRRAGSRDASPAQVETGVDDTRDEFDGWDMPAAAVAPPGAAAAAQPGAGSLSDSHAVSHDSSSHTGGAWSGPGGASPSLDAVFVPRKPAVGAVGGVEGDISPPVSVSPVAASAAARPGPRPSTSAASHDGPSATPLRRPRGHARPGRSSPLVPSAEALASAASAAAVTAPAPAAAAEFPSRLPHKTHDVRGSASPPAAPASRSSPSAFSGGVAQEAQGGASAAGRLAAAPEAAYPVLVVSGGGGAFLHPTNMGVEHISVGACPSSCAPHAPSMAPP